MHSVRLGSLSLVIPLAAILSGCQSVSQHIDAVQNKDSATSLTVGKVQREIRVGMTNADVAEILGSPNIVSTDEQRREVWVYDKIATDRAYSTSSGGVSALVLGFATGVGGLAGGSFNNNAGASSTSQRTLTIIIKFDKDGRVRDFAYHQSKF